MFFCFLLKTDLIPKQSVAGKERQERMCVEEKRTESVGRKDLSEDFAIKND